MYAKCLITCIFTLYEIDSNPQHEKMIKSLAPLVLAILLITASCNPNKPTLKVTFSNVEDGIAILHDTRNFITDTLTINDGILESNRSISSPGVYWLWMEGYNEFDRAFWLVLSSETTEVHFDDFRPVKESQNIFEIYPNQPTFRDDPNHNEEFYNYQQEWLIFYDSIINLSSSDKAQDTLLEMRKALYLDFVLKAENRVANNSERLVSAIIFEHLRRNNLLQIEKIQQLYEGLSIEVKENPYLDEIKTEAGFQPGTPAPNFNVTDIKGNSYSLDGLKGTKVLLHFWSSTCAPCLKEAPQLISIQEAFENLKILNISLDTDKNRWVYGINHAGINDMINICDLKGLESKIVQDYGIRGIPSYYLIDENGNIITKGDLRSTVSML